MDGRFFRKHRTQQTLKQLLGPYQNGCSVNHAGTDSRRLPCTRMPPAFATSTYHPSHPSHGHSYRVKSSGPWAFLRARAAAHNAQSCLQSCSCAGTGAFSHPTQRLQTGLLFLPLIQMPHPVGPLLDLILTVCLLRFAAKIIGSPSPLDAFRFIDSTPGGLEVRVAHTG